MLKWIATMLATLTMAVAASAQTLYIPASANASGANQTNWKTDLQIKARGDSAAAFTIELLETSKNNTDPVVIEGTVEAGESRRFANVLETEFGHTGTAALRLIAIEGGIIATSRTFNDDPRGTFGQTVPAVADSDGLAFGSRATLILLSRSPDPSMGFRTNIGLVNLVASSTIVEVNLYQADGSLIGSLNRTLKPFEHRQLNDVFHMAGADDVADGYAVVHTNSEDGRFLTYASVVDNGSGDAVFILGDPDNALVSSEERFVVFEAFFRPG